MALTYKEKRRTEMITKLVISMIPYVFLLLMSLIWLGIGSKSGDEVGKILYEVIKYGLFVFDIFAAYALVRKIIELYNLLKSYKK